MNNYFQKYLKYKQKYQELKGGAYSKRKDFLLLKYESPLYKTGIIKKNNVSYNFKNSFISDDYTTDIYEGLSQKKIVNYDENKYILYCRNSDKKINIEVNLNLMDTSFIINIKKDDELIKINLEGNFCCKNIELFLECKYTINKSNININNLNYPFIIENKNYTLKEIFNQKIVTIDCPNEKKLDELFDFNPFTILNIFNEKSDKIYKDFNLYKVAKNPNGDILVYDEDKKNFLNYALFSLITLDGNKKFYERNNDYEISYLYDLDYTVYVDNKSKIITKIIHKNCTINGNFTYIKPNFNINTLDNLIINNITFNLSNFISCKLTDFFKNKYNIKEIISCDSFLNNILKFLNTDDPKLNDIKNITFDQITSTIYDYEDEYDKFRDVNLNSICMGQSILFKSIYNSLFNLFYIKNRDEINKIRNISVFITTYLIRKKLLIKFQSIKSELINICTNTDDRNFLLQNITKKITTTNKDFEIFSKKTDNFIDFPVDMKLIFDTGNALQTAIGRSVVKRLGLEEKDTFIASASGVGGTSEYDGKYVTVKLKFKSNTPFNIKDKVYEFNAIVSGNNLTDTLLLGQGSKGLKQFFEDNYCIVYDNSKIEYDNKYQKNLVNITKDIENAKNVSTEKEINDLIYNITTKIDNYARVFLDDKLEILFNELKNDKFLTFINSYLTSIKNNESNSNAKIKFIIHNNNLLRSILDISNWKRIKRKLNKYATNNSIDQAIIDEIKKLK
jgi:hypothetical protein